VLKKQIPRNALVMLRMTANGSESQNAYKRLALLFLLVIPREHVIRSTNRGEIEGSAFWAELQIPRHALVMVRMTANGSE